jgi:Phosphotransferase enzyme family
MLAGHGGNRLEWTRVPERVREAIGRAAGAPVVEALSQPGGFSPGLAARLLLADGRRVFAKAVGVEQNEVAVRMHRREAEVAAGLPASVRAPRLLWSVDLGDWVAMLFADVDGRAPAVPWRAAEWARVHAAVVDLASTPAPDGVRSLAAKPFTGWRSLAADPVLAGRIDPWAMANLDRLAELESRWAEAVAGDRLVHGDLRADNMVLAGERVWFVDWPHAGAGAPWVDLVFMLPCVSLQGGPEPARGWESSPLAVGADRGAVDVVLAGLTGYFTHSALLPAPPGLPVLREFQHRQAEPALAWLRARIG